MVKNTCGGNKSKQFARKQSTATSNSASVRLSEHVDEVYAKVTKPLGNGRFSVVLINKKTIMMHLPAKFKHNRSQCNVSTGMYVLVGIRETTNRDVCDLMEIYTDQNVKQLFKLTHDAFFTEETTKTAEDIIEFTNTVFAEESVTTNIVGTVDVLDFMGDIDIADI